MDFFYYLLNFTIINDNKTIYIISNSKSLIVLSEICRQFVNFDPSIEAIRFLDRLNILVKFIGKAKSIRESHRRF